MNTPLTVLLCVSWLLLVVPDSTYAYLDPGSGSMMLQLLLGGAAGVAVIMKLYWHRFLTVLGIREEKKLNALEETPQDTPEPDPTHSSKG